MWRSDHVGSNRIAFMPGGLIAIILFREVPITIYRIDNCKTMDVGDRSTSVFVIVLITFCAIGVAFPNPLIIPYPTKP